MKMWAANLKIFDMVQNQEYNFIYKMKKITKYIDLYRDLQNILKYHVRSSQIEFTFDYLDKKIQVDDWNKYVLNRDVIEIRIKNAPIVYSLIDSFSQNIIITSLKIDELYQYYQKYLRKHDCAVLIKSDQSLLDVLENPDNYKNRCINRLIHKYKF